MALNLILLFSCICLILLLIDFVYEASYIDGISECFGAASDRNCRYIGIYCLSSISITACSINLWFNLWTALIIPSLRS